MFLVVLGGSWALVQIFEANDPIRPSNVPKVLARVGLQRPGALVQIVDANDQIRLSNVQKVLVRVGLQRPGALVQIVDASLRFLVVSGGSWLFLAGPRIVLFSGIAVYTNTLVPRCT